MTSERIRQLLAEGEGLTIEYKECINELSNSVFETVSSFSNRYGGLDWQPLIGQNHETIFTKIYSGGEPELIEGEVFKTIVPLNGIGASGFTGDGISDGTAIPNAITNAIPNVITNNETRQKLLAMIDGNPSITSKLLGEKLGISERNVKTHIKTLKDAGFLVRVGGTRGHWEVSTDKDGKE